LNPFDEIHAQSRKWEISDEGIEMAYDADFLGQDDADRLFDALKTEIEWRRVVLRTPSGPQTVPRMSSWHADRRCPAEHDGLPYAWRDWTPGLREVRDRLRARLDVRFDAALASFYENERDTMPLHAEVANGFPVTSVSLGWTREMILRHELTSSRHVIPLEHGSLLVMSGKTQQVSRHALPRSRRSCGPCIGLTFRVVGGPT